MRKRIFLIIAMAFFSLTSFTVGDMNNTSISYTSNTLTLPVIVGHSPKDIMAHEGETVLFYVKYKGTTKLTYTVCKGSKEITTDKYPRIKITTTSENGYTELIVRISDVALTDAGTYKVKNGHGSCKKKFKLIVIPRDN